MGSRSVIVAVIDDGIDQNHRDLRGNIVDGYDIVNNSPYTITNGDHGTHVAGIISGVSNNALGGTGVTRLLQLCHLMYLQAIPRILLM